MTLPYIDTIWHKGLDKFDIPPPMDLWLTQPYILSEALERFYPIHLEVLEQSVRKLNRTEANLPEEKALIREIALRSPEAILTLGRVLIPLDIYETFAPILDQMVDVPIGKHWLYNHKGIRRSGFEFALIKPNSEYGYWIKNILGINKHGLDLEGAFTPSIYARRSYFWLNELTYQHFKDKPITVMEYFVETMPWL